MSDIGEPPSKVAKYEMSQTYTQPDEMDEGQEEWLSEEMLTDDDYNETTEQDPSVSALANHSQMSSSQDNMYLSSQNISEKVDDSNIEETLNSLESERQNDLSEDLDSFLVKKPKAEPAVKVKKSDDDVSDGNDTDDLLRMLEDDGKSKKTKTLSRVKEKQLPQPASSDEDDDDFIYKGQSVQKLKVAKSVLSKKQLASKAVPEDLSEPEEGQSAQKLKVAKRVLTRKQTASKAVPEDLSESEEVQSAQKLKVAKRVLTRKQPASKAVPEELSEPEEGQSAQKLKVAKSILTRKLPASKAVPEDLSESEESSEDGEMVKKMFAMKRSGNYAAKSTASRNSRPVKVASMASLKKKMEKRPTSTPNKSKPQTRSYPKMVAIPNGQKVVKQVVRHVHSDSKVVDKTVDRITAVKSKPAKPPKPEPEELDEIIDEGGFMEDDDFDLDEEFATESDSELDRRARKQPIMRPEQVDEDMLSDIDSFSEDDDSHCNDFLSSDSDGLEDCFNLDIRMEKAGDYLPLLGANAYELLQEEKKRVTSRLALLKESITNLTANGRRQSDKLRSATSKLAEIEDMLKAC